jgi:hypothetical protein
MKHSRSFQLLCRLTRWRDLYEDLRLQPFITCCQEVDFETIHTLFKMAEVVAGCPPKITIYAPLEVEVLP